jgi:putative SOS response-associated peptidase YedK
MPVVLPEDAWAAWLDPLLSDAGLLESLLAPAPDELLELRPVSPLVNSPNNEGPELLLAPASAEESPPEELTLFGNLS